MHMSQHVIAQIESGVVDWVRDFNMGDRPRSAMYIRIADLAVARRECASEVGVDIDALGALGRSELDGS